VSLPVPLRVRLNNHQVTPQVSGLQFRKEAIGGVKSLSFTLNKSNTDITSPIPFSTIYIYDARSARVIAEGRVDAAGRTVDSGGRSFGITAFGPAQHASDNSRPYVIVDGSLESFRRFGPGSTRNASTGTDERNEDEPSLLISAEEGKTVDTNWRGDMISRVMRESGMTLGRVRTSIDAGMTSSDYSLRLVTRIGDAGGTLVDSSTPSTTPSVLSATRGTIPANHDTFTISVIHGASLAAGAENTWFEFWKITQRALLKTATGVDITSGYANDYVLAHEVVADLVGRVLDQYDGASAVIDTAGTYQIDQLAYTDGVTAEQVLSDLMLLEPAYRWTTGPDTGNGYAFVWAPWPTTVRYEMTLDDGGDFPISAQELFNQVTVRWRSENGRIKSITRTGSNPLLEAEGVTRTYLLDLGDEIGSTAAAVRAGDNFLAEHQEPKNAGTLRVARPIRDLARGCMVEPFEIEPGELIRVRGVESYSDALNASSNDGVTIFRIWAMTYSSDDNSAALELDTDARTTSNALAALAKRRNRKR
jgi:hypothetical protein